MTNQFTKGKRLTLLMELLIKNFGCLSAADPTPDPEKNKKYTFVVDAGTFLRIVGRDILGVAQNIMNGPPLADDLVIKQLIDNVKSKYTFVPVASELTHNAIQLCEAAMYLCVLMQNISANPEKVRQSLYQKQEKTKTNETKVKENV